MRVTRLRAYNLYRYIDTLRVYTDHTIYNDNNQQVLNYFWDLYKIRKLGVGEHVRVC